MPRPFLRWAGSKRQLVPQLREFWSDERTRYIEPFMGSACLFFALEPAEAVLGDLNRDLVHTFKYVRDKPVQLANRVNQLPKGERAYYRIRSTNPNNLRPLSRAARFIYLNRFCFNGLYRTNKDGEFNVPYGGKKTGRLPDSDWLKACAGLLDNSQLHRGDFQDVIERTVSGGDFVYLDPPYSVNGRRMFREYGPSAFGPNDIGRLVETIKYIDSKNATFVLSYAESEQLCGLDNDWRIYPTTVRRNIAGFSESRGTVEEVIVTNDRTPVPIEQVDGA